MTHKRILIVEDEKITALEMAEHLQQLGYQPLGPCATGEEAIASACALRPDAILMDLALAGPMDGIQAAEVIRSTCPCPVIYVTALSDQVTLDRAKVTEPFGYVLKPINERELHIAIEIALHRQSLEAKLRETEERYRTAIENSNDGVVITQEGKHVYVNHKFLEMFGYSDPEEILNKSIADAPHMHPDDLERVVEWNRQRLCGETVPLRYEHKAIHKDGRTIYVELSSARIMYQGKVASLSYMRDITERKNAGEALKLSEEKYRSLVESSSDAIFTIDTQRIITSCNQAFLDLFGYEREEVENRSVRLIHPSDASFDLYGQKAYPVIQKQGTFRTQWDFARKDGTTVHVESVTFAIRRPDEATEKFGGIIRDITERKRVGAYREMGREALQILNEPGDMQDSIRRVLAALKTRTGLDAVGIRLHDGDDFPYFAQTGFAKEFLLTENTLIERAADGGVCRDKDGNVSLECTCGLVISGKTDPANPLFTLGGSCWTNDSFPLLDIPPGEDPRLNPRNQCMHQGYASMALAPIRNKERIVGLIQLNDRRKDRFTLETVELLEGIASHIGEALMRKQAEETLRESERRLRSVFGTMSLIGVMLDSEGRIMFCNDHLLNLTGWTRDELLGQSWFDYFLPPDVHDEIQDGVFLKKIAAGEVPTHYENEIVTRQGERRLVSWNNTMLRDTGGLVLGTASVGEDITSRKRAEAALRESLERLEFALQGGELGMWDWYPQTGEVSYNDLWAQMLEYRPDEVEPNVDFFKQHIHSEDQTAVLDRLTAHVEGRMPVYESEHRLRTKSGRWLWVLDRGKVVVSDKDGSPVRVTGIIADITERKHAEEKIRASLKEKEVLLKEIHHRVKNNLQIVSSLLFLQSSRTEHPEAAAVLRESRNRVRSMALIHERLYQSPNLASIDMGKYTKSLVSDLRRSYGAEDSSVRLTVTVGDIPLGITEAIPCGLIINELVSNALKHAFPKGRAGDLTIQLVRGNTNHITLTVSDNGIGFPEHVDFRQSPSLGLTLVNALVEQLNGTIELDRREGTTFTITFNVSG